jgi:hypothetical protein
MADHKRTTKDAPDLGVIIWFLAKVLWAIVVIVWVIVDRDGADKFIVPSFAILVAGQMIVWIVRWTNGRANSRSAKRPPDLP